MKRAMIKSFNTHENHYLANWSEAEIHGVNSIPLGNKKKALAQLRRLHESNNEKI